MKKHLSTILLVLLMLTGICLILYPSVSDYWNSLHQSRAIENYAADVAKMDTAQHEEMRKAAEDYNRVLAEAGHPLEPDQKKKNSFMKACWM